MAEMILSGQQRCVYRRMRRRYKFKMWQRLWADREKKKDLEAILIRSLDWNLQMWANSTAPPLRGSIQSQSNNLKASNKSLLTVKSPQMSNFSPAVFTFISLSSLSSCPAFHTQTALNSEKAINLSLLRVCIETIGLNLSLSLPALPCDCSKTLWCLSVWGYN